jgi:8-oxo-dGTP pyrophosphatase MutT (NUDIX family)
MRSKLLSRKIAFSGRVFRVERDTVRLPNGRRSVQDIVRHRGSVVLVPLPKPGHVILIRQYRHAIGRWIWELPAGTLDPGESVRHAARRECEEEIGLTPRGLTRVAALYQTPGICDERMVFYLCTRLVPPKGHVAHDADEDIHPRTFSLEAAARLVSRGEILDMKTVIGLSLARR